MHSQEHKRNSGTQEVERKPVHPRAMAIRHDQLQSSIFSSYWALVPISLSLVRFSSVVQSCLTLLWPHESSLLLLLLSRFSHVRLCVTPKDGSPPGSPVPGILQARTLEWVAIAFSNAWKWKVNVKSHSPVRLFSTPWTAAYQAPPPMGFPRQEDWSGTKFHGCSSPLYKMP